MWGIRSVALKDIPEEYREGLKEGMWICFRCATPEMLHSPELGVRKCIMCGGTVRSSNPLPWCEQCNRRMGRNCLGCGKELDRVEYQFCTECGKERKWPANTTYFNTPGGGSILSTRRPMKPGPGGIKSRNRAGLSLIELKEELQLELERLANRLHRIERQEDTLRRNQAAFDSQAAAREEHARWCQQNDRAGEAAILEAEAQKLRDSAREISLRLEELGLKKRSLEEKFQETGYALLAVHEVRTWRPDLPVENEPPPPRDKGAHAWNPIYPITNELIESDRLDIEIDRKEEKRPKKVGDWARTCELCYKETDQIQIGEVFVPADPVRTIRTKTRACKECWEKIEQERARTQKQTEYDLWRASFREALRAAVSKLAAATSANAIPYFRIDNIEARAYTAYVFVPESSPGTLWKKRMVDGFDITVVHSFIRGFDTVVLWHILPPRRREVWTTRLAQDRIMFSKYGLRRWDGSPMSAYAISRRFGLSLPSDFPLKR
jgi:PAS domain-containing protein